MAGNADGLDCASPHLLAPCNIGAAEGVGAKSFETSAAVFGLGTSDVLVPDAFLEADGGSLEVDGLPLVTEDLRDACRRSSDLFGVGEGEGGR